MSRDVPLRTEHAPAQRPLLVWDEGCAPCCQVVERIGWEVGDLVDRVPGHEAEARLPDLPSALFEGTILLVETDGRVYGGADAVVRALGCGGRRRLAWCHAHVPGFALGCELAYAVVVRGRGPGPGKPARLVRWLMGPDFRPGQYRLTRWLFLRLLGVVALCAFASLAVQQGGLIGTGGIEPAAEFMDMAERVAVERETASGDQRWNALERYLYVPTLCWISASDGFLWALVCAGLVLAVLLIVDVAPGPCILGLWACYLSLVTVGGVFLRFQWDALLIEALFAALFLAPWRLRPRLASDAEPLRMGVWLVRFLVFKLMFLSGLVKLMADDPVWADLTALEYHFFTQPLPTWTAYYAHHAPGWLLAGATLGMLMVELVLPWFTLGPRRLRLGFALGTWLLMAGIAATGNYGFFNLLTVALAIMLLDDTALWRLVPGRLRAYVPNPAYPAHPAPWARRAGRLHPESGPGPRAYARRVGWALAVVMLCASAVPLHRRMVPGSDLGQWLVELTGPLHIANSYGLFANMTTTRPEIIIEGSRDRVSWERYDFRWKPGDLSERPEFVGPHMPRLDWQMWFAALSRCRNEPWLHQLMLRLLQGSPAVRNLLAHDPFGSEPPQYLRTTLYLYTFTDPAAAHWWQQEHVGAYCPVVTLQDGELVIVP